MVLALAACARAPEPVRREFFALGTLVEITVYGLDEARALAAIGAARAELERLDAAWRPWGAGELGTLNRALEAGASAPVSAELAALLARAAALERASGGRFNAGIGQLVRLWDFDGEAPQGPPPDAGHIAAWRAAAPGLAALRVAGGVAASANRALAVDLGAIGKGYGARRAGVALASHGVRDALLAVGGDILALGQAGGRPWRIAIRGPRGGLLGGLTLASGEAVSTSGDYERYYVWNGRRFHHLLDPATGADAGGVREVLVVTDDPVLADAAATALFVAGPAHWREVARDLGVEVALAVRADGTIAATPAARRRVEPVDGRRFEEVP
jgi:FAD:protein FMN transferase